MLNQEEYVCFLEKSRSYKHYVCVCVYIYTHIVNTYIHIVNLVYGICCEMVCEVYSNLRNES